MVAQVSEEAKLQAYMTEYEQCMESYRNTYETIWQVGSIFAVIAGGLFAFPVEGDGVLVGQVLAPASLAFWYVGVFLPMDKYGEVRRQRLVDLEKALNQEWGLSLSHYCDLESKIEKKTPLFWVVRWPLRVRHAVHLFGAFLIGAIVLQLFTD